VLWPSEPERGGYVPFRTRKQIFGDSEGGDPVSGKSPAGPLIHEHRVIERAIHSLDKVVNAIGETGAVDPAYIDTVVDFIRTYADRCHHGKEEDILFRGLATKPLSEDLSRMMQELIEDHVFARATTRRRGEENARYAAGETAALDRITEAARVLVGFYPQHIEKEDRRFFKPCLEYFTDDEKVRMLVEYDEFDRTLIHQKYLDVVERLEARGT
jgi:hemerythrin-like domain-containing protein